MAKRRRIPESEAASEPPKKRITRSSTKANTVAQEPKSKSSKPDPSPPKAKGKPKNKTKKTTPTGKQPKTQYKPSEEPAERQSSTEPTSAPQNAKNLTIASELVPKPIECHQYDGSKAAAQTTPTLIFTHGAGGTLRAPAVVNFCIGYSTSSPVLAFQGSLNLNARVKGFHACIEHLKEKDDKFGTKTLLFGGRSMGARAAVMAANEILAEHNYDEAKEPGLRLILVSYPLKGPKDIRDEILFALPASVHVLFVIGERDIMCPFELLEKTRKGMKAKSELVVVKGADHGMGHIRPKKLEKERGIESGRVAAEWVGGKTFGDVVYVGEDEAEEEKE